MIKSFKHKGLESFFLSGKKKGIQARHSRRLQLILARLHASAEPEDMNLPGLRLHQLTGDREGDWSVKVDGNWRVTYRFKDSHVFDVNYEDYH